MAESYDTPAAETDSEADDETKYWSTEEEVAEDVPKRRKLADRAQSDWREDATNLYQFVAGEQWSEQDVQVMDAAKRPHVTFNRVGPIINAVCGQQVCNRQEPKFLGRETQDQHSAEIWSKVVSWARESCNAEDEESDSFRDMIVTGIGFTCTSVMYDVDPAGMIQEERRDPRRFRWDPSSRKKNLADARWIQCDYWWAREQIEEKWPDKEDIVIEPSAFVNDDEPGQPHDATNAWRYNKNNMGKDLVAGQYRCIHDLHWRLEDVYQIADVDGSITKLTEQEWTQLQDRLTGLGMPTPQVAKTQMRVYYEAWMVGGTVLAFGKYPEADFEYEAMTGLRDDRGQWYGLAKALMDPQRFANKIFSQIISILNSNAKGGIVAEKGAVTNQRKFEEEWSKSDGVAWVEDGAVSNQRIQPKPPPQIPAELTKLLEYSIGGMREVTGVNVEFLGQTDKVQPGVVEAMRTKAGLIILAPWFDAMRLYMKRQGRLLSEYVNKYIADGRWIRITGEAGPQFIQLAKQPDTMKYDIVVDEATQSRDSRERYFQGLLQIMPMVIQSGIPVPPDLIDYLPLPEDLRGKWKQMVLQKMQQPPQPPVQVQIETMRQQGAQQIEGMRQHGKQLSDQIQAQTKQQQTVMEDNLKRQQIAMEAQAERVVQAAQAESERMVEQSKLQLDAVTSVMQMKQDQAKMLLDARLQAFQTILDATVQLQVKQQEVQQQTEGILDVKSSGIVPLFQQMVQTLMQHQSEIADLKDVMSTPVEIYKDPVTGRKTARRVRKTLQ